MTKPFKVIIDTNIWISFLIGKKLQPLHELISNSEITLIITEQLITEIEMVTQRPKLRKYFKKNSVRDLVKLLEIVGENHTISQIPNLCRDVKDNFLLALIKRSKADYLVTGDKDLLVLNPYDSAKILTPSDFERVLSK